MGWYGTYGATRADVVREIVSRASVVDKRVGSGVVWTLERAHWSALLVSCSACGAETDKPCKGDDTCAPRRAASPGFTMIGCYLIRASRDEAAYKPCDETMGPYRYDCPLALLDKADPPVNEYAREWRDKVRAYHAERKLTAATRPAYGDLYRATRDIALSRGAPVPAGSTVRVSSTTKARAIVSTDCGMVRLPLPLARHGLVPLESPAVECVE